MLRFDARKKIAKSCCEKCSFEYLRTSIRKKKTFQQEKITVCCKTQEKKLSLRERNFGRENVPSSFVQFCLNKTKSTEERREREGEREGEREREQSEE